MMLKFEKRDMGPYAGHGLVAFVAQPAEDVGYTLLLIRTSCYDHVNIRYQVFDTYRCLMHAAGETYLLGHALGLPEAFTNCKRHWLATVKKSGLSVVTLDWRGLSSLLRRVS